MARLTIGVPAYNNAGTIRTAIESLLAQSFGDFHLVISDDNSRDETQEVCLGLAKLDKRIEYIRQPKNLKYQNFGFLLRRATTEYFMWGAGDDRWASGYVKACIDELDAHESIVLAVSRVQFEMGGVPTHLSNGTFPLLGSCLENLYEYFSGPLDNSRMYGIFRTEAGQKSFPMKSFHAYDWAFSAASLRFGGHAEIPEELMYRDKTPSAEYTDLAREDGVTVVDSLFPLLKMTRWLLVEARIPFNHRVLGALFGLNVDKHVDYVERYHPKFFRIISPLEAAWRTKLRWRLKLR